ncbi:hypothetical protein [Tessaracoccus sp. OH4464_COT-324]|uniref:hypothetical protein n=1 Tax=Tessaracoccus sp. OH4464_COT-324 TaxID=2491059 RepID=UPI000F633C4D|nr:hypothetical protein [Tessaracoccus sp. OH4464_COT-324]RRD45184.1 hypothetical protein EII42_11675 [Tessaracoccus sp. OH4464_COT-324]
MISNPQIAEIIWQATRAERSLRHHRGKHCPTPIAPYSAGDPHGTLVKGECINSGCLDLLHEAWAKLEELLAKDSTRKKLDGATNPAAYVRRMVTTCLADLRREERVRRGHPAKPSRIDGPAGRVVTALEAVGDGRGQWLVTVFRFLRCYPYGPSHVSGRWPVDGLIAERRALGDEVEASEILGDVREVLRVAEEVLGASWVYDNLTLPTQNSGPCGELTDSVGTFAEPSVEHALVSRLVAHYSHLTRSGKSPDEALRDAVRLTCGVNVSVTQEMREAMEEFRRAE